MFGKLRQKNIINNAKKEKGIAIILIVLVMFLVLSIILSVNVILISESKLTRELGYSVTALYAAEAGMEQVLLDQANPHDIALSCFPSPYNTVCYEVKCYRGTNGINPVQCPGTCTADNYCLKSTGSYQDINRAIQVTY